MPPIFNLATITLTRHPGHAGSEGLFLNGTLPAGLTIAGNGTGIVTLSGQASQADYIIGSEADPIP